MYMQFEEAGLIRQTEEYEKRMEEKENESATDQSCRPKTTHTYAIPMLNLAQGKGKVNVL